METGGLSFYILTMTGVPRALESNFNAEEARR